MRTPASAASDGWPWLCSVAWCAADDTGAIPYGCVMAVDVTGVPRSERPVYKNQLQVLDAPGLLGGYWGCSQVRDDYDPADAPRRDHEPDAAR